LTTAPPNPVWTNDPSFVGETSPSPTPSKHLSGDQVKGIVIGCAIAGVLLFGLAVFFFLWRRKRATGAYHHRRGFFHEKDGEGNQVYEKDPYGDRTKKPIAKTELLGSEVVHQVCYELDSPPNPSPPKSAYHAKTPPPEHPLKFG
jgi:hypothetical protein